MSFRITVLPGDGVGPEVTEQALIVLRAVAARFDHAFEFTTALLGGVAIEATGTALPPETLTACGAADAVLLGAVGGPQWDDPAALVRPEQGLLGIRKALGLFANLRPVLTSPFLSAASPVRSELLAGVDLLFVRELTGGIYFGRQVREDVKGEASASDTCTYTASEIERVVRLAARLARARRGKLTSVDKANVMGTSRLWREVTTRVVRSEFKDLVLEHVLVDAFAMHLIKAPANYDVVVTENLFGDILTDEASVLVGSIGVLPSASLGATLNRSGRPIGLYEPIHGSAPSLAGRDSANPAGMILSAALLLRHSLGLEGEARAIEAAVTDCFDHGMMTADLAAAGRSGCSTSQFGSAVASRIKSAT